MFPCALRMPRSDAPGQGLQQGCGAAVLTLQMMQPHQKLSDAARETLACTAATPPDPSLLPKAAGGSAACFHPRLVQLKKFTNGSRNRAGARRGMGMGVGRALAIGKDGENYNP